MSTILILSYVSVEKWYWRLSSLVAVSVAPVCSDDLLLHFPYNDHYNDVTCHGAIATKYGDNVNLVYDSERNSTVACFTEGEEGTYFEVLLH